jgi:hypothetical protein
MLLKRATYVIGEEEESLVGLMVDKNSSIRYLLGFYLANIVSESKYIAITNCASFTNSSFFIPRD